MLTMLIFRNNRIKILIISIIIVLTALCFYQTLSHRFVNYDDNAFVYLNNNVSEGLSVESIIWAFTTTHMEIWHPITWLSHIIDCELFGLNAGGHHFSSVLFHLLNCLLLFVILTELTGTIWRSALVAVLFAIHPLHIESVAWISIRKDLISTFFVLLSIRSYIVYVQNKNWRNHLKVTLLFALALMSKPAVIYVPILFILLDFWPLGRFEKANRTVALLNRAFSLAKEKIIWFLLSGLIMVVNYKLLSKAGSIASSADLSLSDRIANVLYVIFFYIYKTLYPVSLAVFYPYPKPLGVFTALGGFIIILVTTLLIFKAKKRRPYLLFGWFWFLVGLLPVLGVVQQAQHLVADRYMYVPLIGFSVILVWGVYDALKNIKGSTIILSGISLVMIISCLILSFKQTGKWKNNFTLYENTLRITEENYVVHTNLGAAYLTKQNYEQAIYHYSRAIEIKPYFSMKDIDFLKAFLGISQTGLGNRFLGENKDTLALEQFLLALNNDNYNATNHYNAGNIYARKKQYQEAVGHYEQAIEIDSSYPDVHNNLGIALMRWGKYSESEKVLKNLLNINQQDFVAAYNLACVYSAINKSDAAVERLRQAVSLGFDDWQLIKSDSELDNIRNSKAFLLFLKQHNQK